MPDDIDVRRSTMTLQAIIGQSLVWGLVAGAVCLVFLLSFFSGGNLGPFGALLGGITYGPSAFVMGTFLAGLCRVRRVKTLPKRGRVGYALFLAMLLPLGLLLSPPSIVRLIFG